MWESFSHGCGIIIMAACVSVRPVMVKNSSALSNMAESEPSGRTIGNSSFSSSPNRSVFMWLWRASMRLQLPRMVFISPLCTTMRLGWARSHDGNVLVE